MAHIIINAVGSAGDINPFLPVASKLKEEGHDVDFLASVYFEEKVKRFGLNFLPLGTMQDYEDAISDPNAWKVKEAFSTVWRFVIKSTIPAYEQIEKHRRGKDTILIGSSVAIATRLAQEKFGLRLATVHLAPALVLSAYDTPQSPTNPLPSWLPRPLKSMALSALDRFMLDGISAGPLNEIRAKLELPPVSSVIKNWIHSPELVIFAFPDWFAQVQTDWPPNSYNANFPLFRSQYDPPACQELESFLSKGEKPLVLTAGTAMAFGRPFFETGLAAAGKRKMRCLIVCGFNEQLPHPLPSWALAVSYVNFQTLFSKIAMVAHHGGIGTSAMALACACPQLIAPNAHDQFDNGRRLERLGVGKVIKNPASVESWCSALDRLKERQKEIQQNCAHYQQLLYSDMPGAEAIVEIIKRKLLAELG